MNVNAMVVKKLADEKAALVKRLADIEVAIGILGGAPVAKVAGSGGLTPGQKASKSQKLRDAWKVRKANAAKFARKAAKAAKAAVAPEVATKAKRSGTVSTGSLAAAVEGE